MNIGIIGNGFVGKSTNILKNKNVNIFCYDINPKLCEPDGLTLNDMKKCEIIFVSVPTPMNKDGSVFLNIVESVINELRKINYDGFIVIRSTILPGTSDKLKVYFMPEFLTEKNYINDFKTNPRWIFGLLNTEKDNLFKEKITRLFNFSYHANCIESNKIEWMLNKEAEMVKYFRNTFLSVKVAYCNEMYEYCKSKNIDYERVRTIATLDKRICSSHTQVPGHDGRFGFGGTCFPKDINGLLSDMKKNKIISFILNATVNRNETRDRPEKDWLLNKGRTII
jgi:nucleotide sugar dehydrogenase